MDSARQEECIDFRRIIKPTLLVNKQRAVCNIERMAAKAQRSGVRLRPHFKTHQSAAVGEWFRDFGVSAITVSSVDMASFFASHGWNDITIAFPANTREIDRINELATKVHLSLLVESSETVDALSKTLSTDVGVWIKIDVGSKRTGIRWDDSELVTEVARAVSRSNHLVLSGLLTHSGHSYRAKPKDQIREIYRESVHRLQEMRQHLESEGFSGVELSIGDTPCCSVVEDFSEVNEIRPGNFVFYDSMQLSIGSCTEEDIAVAVACPVVAIHPERSEIVIYGGAVHLSKESIPTSTGAKMYGLVALLAEDGWGPILGESYVSSVSQEHGIVQAGSDLLRETKPGDLLLILPVHSCLTVNLMRTYLTTDGELLKTSGI